MDLIVDIPEIRGLDSRQNLIRIPRELDAPLTPRVQSLIDSAEFRRLTGISQLGLVSYVYPGACHHRFEHSLGVYRLCLIYLKHLAHDERFAEAIRPEDAELLIAASLLHDLGHWPFCHPIEDMHLPGIPDHEHFANSYLLEGEIADALREEWGIQPRDLVSLLSEKPRDPKSRILHSILSGPIDVDKMDYLVRDSLHTGVPYGQNFDQQRLIASLQLNQAGDGLAISEKGRTAAEMMVFARYVMFSEVYWHHAVRSATAMLQRAFFLLHKDLEIDTLFRMNDARMVTELVEQGEGGPAGDLLSGLFGPTRKLYKRAGQYSFFQEQEVYHQLARRPYPWLATCAEHLAGLLSRLLGKLIAPHEILIDAPPMQLEVEFHVEIYYPKEQKYRLLGDVSPVVQTLAKKQFDDYVKRVRIFAHPRIAEEVSAIDLAEIITEAVEATG
jgi:HD superfamily phosphohydrolase